MSTAPTTARPRRRARILAAVVAVGIGAGVVSGLLTWLLRATVAIGIGPGAVHATPEGFQGISWPRRILVPTVGAMLVALAWQWLRRRHPTAGVRASLADGSRIPVRATLADACVQIIGVGAGLSVGREGAPRQASAALGDWLARRWHFPDETRSALVASAAGAGLAAVYNVPLAGVAFAIEVLGRRCWGIALATTVIATVTAWPLIGFQPMYTVATAPVSWLAWPFAIVMALAGVVLGRGFARLARLARQRAPRPGWQQVLAIVAAGVLVGGLSCWVPEMPGNGKGLVELALAGTGTVALFLAVSVVKPLLTCATLGSGVAGGLLTPALATGATFGAACAVVLGTPSAVVGFALIGAAAVLAASEGAPVFAGLLVVELTRPPATVVAAIALCVATSFIAQRLLRRT